MMMRRAGSFFMIVICLIPVWGFASWKTMSNDYFMVYYRSGIEDEALYKPSPKTSNRSHLDNR